MTDTLVAGDPPPPSEAPPATMPPDEPPSEGPPGKLPWKKIDTIALLLLLLVGGGIRLFDIADPPDLVFDEVYYAKDACFYATQDPKLCGIPEESTYVHPPLGKALISIGVAAFGFDSFGWRFVPMLAGIASIAFLFLIGRRLFKSTLAASFATLLLVFDFLHFVQSRAAMLDIFVVMFGLAAVLAVLKDRDRMIRESYLTRVRRPGLGRPWRAVAGVCAGAATACKWSGGLVLVVVFVLTLAWEFAADWRQEDGRSVGKILRDEAPSIVLWLVVLPALVYVATYIGHTQEWGTCPDAKGFWLNNVLQRQRCMYDFHKNLVADASHSYQSPPWSWILLKRPVSYFFCSGADCAEPVGPNDYSEIVATGSPFVWWTSILAMIYVAIAWFKRRDWRGPEGFILAGFLLTYGPWLLLAKGRGAVFIFYLLPTVPFMCLALAYVGLQLGRSWEARTALALYAVTAVGMFGFYYPLLAKQSLPKADWDKRIWIFDECGKPEPKKVPTTVTVTGNDGEETTQTSLTTEDQSSTPPSGWCWI